MTEKELKAIRAIETEIKSIELSIKKCRGILVTDFYKDYKTGKGKVKGLVGIEEETAEKIALEIRLQHKRNTLIRTIDRAEQWLDTLGDPEMQAILRMYYVCGLTQEDIAEKTGIKNQETISRRIARFWLSGNI